MTGKRPRPRRAAAGVLLLAGATCWAPVHAAAGGEPTAAPAFSDAARHTAASVWSGAQDLAIFALGMIGVDYRFGGTTPEAGLDCSGLVRYVFQQVTGVTLPRTAKELSRLGNRVSAADLKPGDLVFFNTRRFPFSHVGIYLGDNRFVHAPSRGGEVEIVALSQTYWRRRFDGARRLVGVMPDLIPRASAQAPAPSEDLADPFPVTRPSPAAEPPFGEALN